MPSPEFEHEDAEDAEFEAHATDSGRLTQDEVDDQARMDIEAYNPELQRIVLPEGATTGDMVAFLTKSIPTNEYGLPAFYYRSDILPAPEFLTQGACDPAIVSLDYAEGFPTYGGGKLWWFQLPHESYPDYVLFQRYLDQVETEGLRQLQLLAMENSMSFDKIKETAQQYYWSYRSRAYDLFHIAADRKRREARGRKMEASHYDLAEQLMAPLRTKFQDPEYFDKLEPKEAVEVLRLLINIQRVSNGLAQNGNAGKEVYNPDGAMAGAILMRTITEGTGTQDEGLGLGGNLQALLADPSFAFEAQKLVIRVRHADKDSAGQSVNVRAIENDA